MKKNNEKKRLVEKTWHQKKFKLPPTRRYIKNWDNDLLNQYNLMLYAT